MKPEARDNWTAEDFELEKECAVVSRRYRETVDPPPRVHPRLDRRIREQARYHIGAELRDSWVFGHVPQLSLAASILFGIGVYFVVAIDNEPAGVPVSDMGTGYVRPAPVPRVEADHAAAAQAPLAEARRAKQVAVSALTSGVRDMEPQRNIKALAGAWRGTNSLWLEPEGPADVSDSTAAIESVGNSRFLTVSYTWSFKGNPHDGMIILSPPGDAGDVTATWFDSWHYGDGQMALTGQSDATGAVSVDGTYAAPPGPDWGWRIELRPVSPEAFTMRMYNVTPDGESALAVEATYQRE